MKKSKFLVGTLVLVAALMGTGYAAWTDVLGVNATVSTGEFTVAFTGAAVQKTGNAAKDKLDVRTSFDANYATVEIDNIYPGAETQVSFDIQNTGDVSAILSGVEYAESEGTMAEALEEFIEVRLNVYNSQNESVLDTAYGLEGDFVKLSELKTVAPLVDAPEDNELNFDETHKLFVHVRLSEDTTDDFEGQDVKLSFLTDWKQFNVK